MYIYIRKCATYKKFKWMNDLNKMDKFTKCILEVEHSESDPAYYKFYDEEIKDYWYYKSEAIILLDTFSKFKNFRKHCKTVYRKSKNKKSKDITFQYIPF